ncbi:hypothetical protein E2C01_040886 [Portunus trituberculatus]|uniref:Uncharacterized protein n=1 Tax=Portunus trituberculatus TaxID=210409 RepID=A0A5B7FHT1_PORTR|nr:hypothetical protein [Portunus trituberculatus]
MPSPARCHEGPGNGTSAAEADMRGQGRATHVPTSIHTGKGDLTTNLSLSQNNKSLALQTLGAQPWDGKWHACLPRDTSMKVRGPPAILVERPAARTQPCTPPTRPSRPARRPHHTAPTFLHTYLSGPVASYPLRLLYQPWSCFTLDRRRHTTQTSTMYSSADDRIINRLDNIMRLRN